MISIKKNGVDVKIAELTLLNGKEVLVVGEYDRDLILRTKGSVRIQVQNKFIDLLEASEDIINSSSNLTVVSSLEEIVEIGLYFNTSDLKFYYNDGTTVTPVTDDDSDITTGNYVSYTEELIIQNEQFLKNINTQYDSILSLPNDSSTLYEGQIVYFQDLKGHYQLVDIDNYRSISAWSEMYISLLKGGNVKGATHYGELLNNTPWNFSLSIYSQESGYYNNNLDLYKALFIGDVNKNEGLAVSNDAGLIYFESISFNEVSGFLFTTRVADKIYTPFRMVKNKVAFADDVSYKADFNVNLSSLFRKNVYLESNIQTLDYTAYSSKERDYFYGFALLKDPDTYLEIDRVFVKNPEPKPVLHSTDIALLHNRSYRIRTIDMSYETPIYLLAQLTGRYATMDVNDPVLWQDRGVKVQVYDYESDSNVVTDVFFGIGDRDSAGVVLAGTTYDYDGLTFTVPTGDFTYNVGTNEWDPDVSGTHKYVGNFGVYIIKFYESTDLEVGDFLLNIEETREGFIRYGGAFKIRTINVVDDETEVIVEAFQTDALKPYKDMYLIKVGNVSGTSLGINNTLLEGLTTLNDLFPEYYNPYVYDLERPWFTKTKVNSSLINTTIGNLSLVEDVDFTFTGDNGLYSNNAYIKGQILPTYLDLDGVFTWDGLTLEYPRIDAIESDIVDIFTEINNLTEEIVDFFPTVPTTDVFLNFRDGRSIQTQSLVNVFIYINVNVNNTGVDTIHIESLPLPFDPANGRNVPVTVTINDGPGTGILEVDPLNRISIKKIDGTDFSIAVHEMLVKATYYV